MTTRTRDCKTFHFLIKTKQNKTKQKTKRIAQDLNVNGEIHTGDQACGSRKEKYLGSVTI
jgi:hypothetical protein